MDYKKEYAQLLASGIFFEMFPFLGGNWEDDKEAFIELLKNKEI